MSLLSRDWKSLSYREQMQNCNAKGKIATAKNGNGSISPNFLHTQFALIFWRQKFQTQNTAL
jgi:hypothetical protein